MKTRDGVLWLLTWAIAAFALLYAIAPPAPKLVVPDGHWQWQPAEGVPAIGWYGRLAWALAGAALAVAVAYAVHDASGRIRRFIDSKRGVHAMTAVVFIALVAATFFLAYSEWQHWIRP